MTVLSNVSLADGRHVDLRLAAGAILEVAPAGMLGGDDWTGWLLLPGLAEPHAHIDKALTAEVIPNPSGDLMGAIEAWQAAAPRLSVSDMQQRAVAAIERYVVHGATTIRTHVNIGGAVGVKALQAVRAARETAGGIADVEIVALIGFPLTGVDGANNRAALEEALEIGFDVMGGVPSIDPDPEGHLALVLDTAAQHDMAVDLHIDETTDADVLVLAHLGEEVRRRDLHGRVTASHCVSLGMQEAGVQADVAASLAGAGIGVVANPQTNLYLQAWRWPTAPPRGLTAIEALLEAGVVVAGGGDNIQDPFNPMGRGDPLETASLLVTAGHLRPEDAVEAVSNASRSVMGRPQIRFEPGDPADFTAIRAASVREAIAELPSRRVFRSGELVAQIDLERRVLSTEY